MSRTTQLNTAARIRVVQAVKLRKTLTNKALAAEHRVSVATIYRTIAEYGLSRKAA